MREADRTGPGPVSEDVRESGEVAPWVAPARTVSRPFAEIRCAHPLCGKAYHPHSDVAKAPPPKGPIEEILDSIRKPRGRTWRGQAWTAATCRLCRKKKSVSEFYESGGKVCKRCTIRRRSENRRRKKR